MPRLYTLKKTARTQRYILKFDQRALEAMLAEDAEAFALALNRFKAELRLLGRPATLDFDNLTMFLQAVNADENGVWKSKFSTIEAPYWQILNAFKTGVEQSTMTDFPDLYRICASFLSMLDNRQSPSIQDR